MILINSTTSTLPQTHRKWIIACANACNCLKNCDDPRIIIKSRCLQDVKAKHSVVDRHYMFL